MPIARILFASYVALQVINQKFGLFYYCLDSFLTSSHVPKKILASHADVVFLPPPYTPPEVAAGMVVPVRYQYRAQVHLGNSLLEQQAAGLAMQGGGGSTMDSQLLFKLPEQYKHAAVLPMHLTDLDIKQVLKPLEQVSQRPRGHGPWEHCSAVRCSVPTYDECCRAALPACTAGQTHHSTAHAGFYQSLAHALCMHPSPWLNSQCVTR